MTTDAMPSTPRHPSARDTADGKADGQAGHHVLRKRAEDALGHLDRFALPENAIPERHGSGRERRPERGTGRTLLRPAVPVMAAVMMLGIAAGVFGGVGHNGNIL